jgi:DNA-binding NarL/FixJ family response regulator
MSQDYISILLVDDHKVLRDGLRALLESEDELQVVGEAGTGAAAVEQALSLRPDVIVMDLGLPDISGLKAIEQIRIENEKSKIIVLSTGLFSSRKHCNQIALW